MDGFSSLEELYKRIKPALKTKKHDLKRMGITYIQEADIWNYLRDSMWTKKTNLTLGEMVNDIMCVPYSELEDYVKSVVLKEERKVITE